MSGRGTHFDPDIVDAFLRCFEQVRKVRPSALRDAGPAGLTARRPKGLAKTTLP